MEIYKIESDYQYKNISSKEDSVINQFNEFEGQSLKEDWIVPKFQLLEDGVTTFEWTQKLSPDAVSLRDEKQKEELQFRI